MSSRDAQFRKGRGSLSNRESRYSPTRVEADGDAADADADANAAEGREPPNPATVCSPETAKSIIARNQSPDIPFAQSINPYRGCEHGCIYCYARPTHAWLDLSPGLDFETKLSYKRNAAQLLEEELRQAGYECKPITLGANTDPYQPVEKTHRITRQVLEVLQRFRHPVSILTRGTLVTRDIDILSEMAADGLCSAAMSITTMDRELKRTMEPRAPSGEARLQAMEALSRAGIPTSLMFSPVIPALNDKELERIVELAAGAGARGAGYILLRLPLEISALFEEWLREHYPLRADHVMSIVRQSRGGRDYDSRFGHRMRGTGVFAELIQTRFQRARRQHGLCQRETLTTDTSKFRVPPAAGDQFSLSGI